MNGKETEVEIKRLRMETICKRKVPNDVMLGVDRRRDIQK
jgi:hypothetical protein